MERKVNRSGKDRDGDIIRLCGDLWGSVSKADAVRQIENGSYTYFVQQPGTARVDVTVVKGPYGKYLRTTADSRSANNLDNLPNC